jgi:hypothetical protein
VRTAPAKIRLIREGDNPWLEVTIIEGRNRQVRKMFEEVGHHVEKIRRVQYGPLALDVPPGDWRNLTLLEVAKLKTAASGPKSCAEAQAGLAFGFRDHRQAGRAVEAGIAPQQRARDDGFVAGAGLHNRGSALWVADASGGAVAAYTSERLRSSSKMAGEKASHALETPPPIT